MSQRNLGSIGAEIKGGMFPLSVLQLENDCLLLLAQRLDSKIKQAKSFFYKAPLVINLEKVSQSSIDFTELKEVIESRDFICVGVCNLSEKDKTLAQLAGLAILKQQKVNSTHVIANSSQAKQEVDMNLSPQASTVIQPIITKPVDKVITLSKVIKQNVRSGQQIYAKDSDLIIVGSVSNGAEVISDGNIHIYGNLRGRAIAGASGNQGAAIFCHSIEAELISIAGTYWLSDSLPENVWKQSAFIHLEKEQLKVELLKSTIIN